ncbi:MAG: glycosyltransferase [Nitrosomonas sp.]|nr:MAG: glycosyltransferase [Nitrosomonas sp.]
MKNQQVAVITRTKNRVVLLERAIQSVLMQTYPHWIHVIVNDGGDPKAVEALVQQFLPRYDSRVKIVHNPQSLGMEAASNIGIRASSSDYIVIHDDDDSWHPSFLERCITYLNTPPPTLGTSVEGVVTYSMRVQEELLNDKVRIISTDPFNDWMNEISFYRLAASNTFPPISFVFSRTALEEIGFFREDLPVLGDWDFHLRFCSRYEIGLIKETLANYHHRINSHTGDYGNSVIASDNKHRRYENLLRNDLLRNDLKTGKTGLGFLVNIAHSFEILHGQMSFLQAIIGRIKNIALLRWIKHKLLK